MTATAQVGRVVALGASNLTRGLHAVVCGARAVWGRDVEILAALGHGRSYGSGSRFLGRTIPGILQSGLWTELERRPAMPTRALVTDVGNDILYGYSAEQTLAWVEEALDRLARITSDIVLTDLPLASIRRLTAPKFFVFRSILVPSCRLSLAQALGRAEQVCEGLQRIAADRGLRLVRLEPEWYGADPIHVRASHWRDAWEQILGAPLPHGPGGAGPPLEAIRLYLMRPERCWLFGVEQVTPQRGAALPGGAHVWLY